MLTVLERDTDAVYKSGKLVRWKCRCDCGNIKTIIGCNLSKTNQCGCDMYGHNLEDLSQQRFGILTVIKRVENKKIPCGQQQTMWECICDCGSIVQARAASLKSGNKRSCGCIKQHAERLIAELLQKMNIDFEREFEFEDCLSSKGNKLRYDFAIFQQNELSFLIEYQGEQHYREYKKNKEFGKLQRIETDQTKREYCLTHNIPLYEIRYDEDIETRLNNILHDNTVPRIATSD